MLHAEITVNGVRRVITEQHMRREQRDGRWVDPVTGEGDERSAGEIIGTAIASLFAPAPPDVKGVSESTSRQKDRRK